jgi:lipoic acid synthetase
MLTQTGTSTERKPSWLNKKIRLKDCQDVDNLLEGLNLNTICREARCPNISECFAQKTATFLILGDTCTRQCKFCAVKKGKPSGLDLDEPQRVAKGVIGLGLKHVVVTSVTRDDLSDGGADIFAKTVFSIRDMAKDITIEVLIPDFKGDIEALKRVMEAKPDIIAHNVETVPGLYKEARQGADYGRSLSVLENAKKMSLSGKEKIYTKSGIMLGLGEKEEEVLEVFADLRKTDCDFLSIGQYLSPGAENIPVKEYILPDKFAYYKQKALEKGFFYVESGPYVRSSYVAANYLR